MLGRELQELRALVRVKAKAKAKPKAVTKQVHAVNGEKKGTAVVVKIAHGFGATPLTTLVRGVGKLQDSLPLDRRQGKEVDHLAAKEREKAIVKDLPLLPRTSQNLEVNPLQVNPTKLPVTSF